MKPAKAAVQFLGRWCPSGPWVITAIDPDEGFVRTRSFEPADADKCQAFIEYWRDKRNLYFGVNDDSRWYWEVEKKTRKEHIASMRALHVDIDTYKGTNAKDEVLASLDWDLPPGIPGPATLVIDSGNGLQAFWMLTKPERIDGDLDVAEEVERYNRGVALAYHGDMITDITRIMRLPFTFNFPNSKKRDMGLGVSKTSVIWFNPSRTYNIKDFPRREGGGVRYTTLANEEGANRIVFHEAEHVDSVDELDVSERCKLLILAGALPGRPDKGRSEWLYSAILSMLKAGISNERILGVVTNPDFRISDSVLDKPMPDEHAKHQLRRAHAWLSSQSGFDDEW